MCNRYNHVPILIYLRFGSPQPDQGPNRSDTHSGLHTHTQHRPIDTRSAAESPNTLIHINVIYMIEDYWRLLYMT